MISPHVRRLRLAAELRALRTQAGLTHEQLAKRTGQSRAQISRLENGHVASQADVMTILDALGADAQRWTQIMTITREAAEKGWWESTRGIGGWQALYADLEAGATTIRAYQQTLPPELLQTPEFVQARAGADATLGPLTFTVNGAPAGNVGRQRMLRRPGGPTLEVIVDEVAIRRLSAPPDIFTQQLHHLASVCGNGEPGVTLRVLPVNARIGSYTVPCRTFSLYTYPDPGDPAVVAIDTATSSVILTESAGVAPYELLYHRLHEAALSPSESLALLTEAATQCARP